MHSILYSIPTEWFEIRQRFHYLAEAFLEREELLVMAPRSHRRLKEDRRWLELLRPWSTTPWKRGHICSWATLPFYRQHPRLVSLEWSFQIQRIRRAALSYAPYFEILWLADPTQAPLVEVIPHRKLVYECVDDHAGFWQDPGLKARISALEEQLTRKADLVVATSSALQHRLLQWNDQVVLVGNGTDLAFFQPVLQESFPLPPELSALQGPMIGFYGALGDWVDLALVKELALCRPGWHFVLLGPAFADVTALKGLSNVHLLGPRPYPQLRDFLAHIGVWILPFYLDEMTRAVDPLKVYEYLAAGRRVVSTRLPELEPLEPCLSLVEREGWLPALERALAQGPMTPLEHGEVLSRLASRDWQALFSTVREHFAKLLGRTPS